MFARNKLLRVGILSVLLLLLTGCGIFGGNTGLVGQGVAFPQPGDGPPTSESSLPQPPIVSSATPESQTETPTPTPSPTAEPTKTAVPQPTAAPPQILSFTIDATEVGIARKITFTWTSSGGTTARIYNWANGSTRFPAFWDVPTNGTLTVNLSGTRRSDPHFELFVYADDVNGLSDMRSVQIPWDCSLDYFFEPGSDICPWTEPTYTTASLQEFEGGRMVWIQSLNWIYVLYDDVYPNTQAGGVLQWERYDDNWDEEAADIARTLQPPPGFFAPVGPFNLLWQENPTVKERLGWGLAPSESFDGAWQLQPSDTDYQEDAAIFIQLEDGRVARLSGFDTWGWLWALITPVG